MARRRLQAAFEQYGDVVLPDVYILAGETLVKLLEGEIICVETVVDGGNHFVSEELATLNTTKDEIASKTVSYDLWSKKAIDDTLTRLRAECAADPRLVPGTTCWLWGLRAESLRNGTMGTLVKWLPEPRNRWQVQVHNLVKTDKEFVAIKAENLSFYKHPENCAICLAPIVTDCFVTSCDHFFHAKCMKKATTGVWKETGRDMALHCPTCRAWVGCKTDLGFIKSTPIDLVHGVMSHTYQNIHHLIKYDDSADAEAAIMGMWHGNLFQHAPGWEDRVLNLRDKHLAKPTRETGKALGECIYNLLEVAYGKHIRDKHKVSNWQDTELVLKCLPERAFKRAAEGRNAHLAARRLRPLLADHGRRRAPRWRGVAHRRRQAHGPRREARGAHGPVRPRRVAPQPISLQPGGVGTAPSRMAVMDLDPMGEFMQRVKSYAIRKPERCNEISAALTKVVMCEGDAELNALIAKYDAEDAKDAKSLLDAMGARAGSSTQRADDEVVSITSKARGSAQRQEEEARQAGEAGAHYRPGEAGRAPQGPADGQGHLRYHHRHPTYFMKYVDPDLVRCETTNQMLWLQSMEQRMPKDHYELPRLAS